MEAKDKAQELIKKFMPLIPFWDCYWDAPRDSDNMIVDAKNCARIAVEEILSTYETKDLIYPKEVSYWKEVKVYLD